MKVVSLYQCVVCGSQTDWDTALGSEPLCVQCWDKLCDNQKAISSLKYRQHKREKLAAYQRLYYKEKRKERLS